MEIVGLKSKIENYLEKNKRSLEYMESLFSIDDNRDKAEEFYKEGKLKVLCVYLSPATTRAVSNTHNALSSLSKKLDEENILVDSCYFPEDGNLDRFKEAGIPYIFGSACHEPVGFYDLVLMSNAICPEVLNIPRYLEYSGIGLTIEERDKQKTPLICFGGAAANETSIVLGPIYREGKCIGKSLVDIADYGYGEKVLATLCKTLLDYKNEGVNLHDKVALKEKMINDQILREYLFYPQYYEWEYDEDRFTIKSIKCLDERLPETVKYARIRLNEDMGWTNKAFNLSGDNADSHDLMISSGCSGGSSNCSFCMEATVAGGYREKKLEDVEVEMKHTVRNCAPNTISWYSYNLNYYYRFMDLLATGAQYFSGVTLLNERLDVVANSPDQMKLAKKLGLKRFSGPVEGAGERIRDGFLNKNLSRETLMKATHVISELGLMHFKFGMILTGQETEEDMKDFLSEVDEMIKIRDEHGANHSYQINWTPLVLYSQIALRWMPRITAENSYNNARTMSWFIEETRKRNIRCKFNGKGCGTWLEQLILDFGPAGTDWMVGLVLDEGMGYIRFFGDKIKEAACKQLDLRDYKDHLFFTKRRPDDWIFPNDHIDSIPKPLQKQWLERTKAWFEGDVNAFSKQLCLKTPANLEGNKCYGCKMCESKEEIDFMLHRKLEDQHTYDEVAEMLSESREQKTVRVVVKQRPEWFFYNREALSHYITSRFLQANDILADNFFSVGKTTTTWLSNNGQKGWYGGTWAFDINLRDRVSVIEFEKVLDNVNKVLESCQVVRIIDDTKTMKVKRETNISYIGKTTSWSLSQISDKLSMFDWDVKVPVKSMGGMDTELKHMPELKDRVLFAQKDNGVVIGMALPASVSPYFVMSSILGKGYEKMLVDFSFDIIDQTADTDMVDDKGQHIGYSYFKGGYNKEADIQTVRKYLYALTH